MKHHQWEQLDQGDAYCLNCGTSVWGVQKECFEVMADFITTLEQRRNYLAVRIEAKKKVGWEVTWDEAEYRALSWAIEQLKK